MIFFIDNNKKEHEEIQILEDFPSVLLELLKMSENLNMPNHLLTSFLKFSRENSLKFPGGCHYLWVVTHLRIEMSENDSSHIGMVADSVGSDTSQYLWVAKVHS